MEDNFLNIPLDLWRSQWSSGRRRTLTEEWVLLYFQNTDQLEPGAYVLQHLWSLSAPRVKKRNRSIMYEWPHVSIVHWEHTLYLSWFTTNLWNRTPKALWSYTAVYKRQQERGKHEKKEGQNAVRKKVWRKRQINDMEKTARRRTEYILNEEIIILTTNLFTV